MTTSPCSTAPSAEAAAVGAPGHFSIAPDVTTSDATEGEAAARKASARTLRRHRARGTVPAAFRKLGRDGRTYADRPAAPTASGRCDDRLARDLRMAIGAIRRASEAPKFGRVDLDEMQVLAAEAAELARGWREEMAAVLRDRAGNRR